MTARPRPHIASSRIREDDLVRLTGERVGTYRVKAINYVAQIATLHRINGQYVGQFDIGLLVPLRGGTDA